MRYRPWLCKCLAALALLLAAPLPDARAGSKSGSHQFAIGNNNAGVTADFSAGYQNSSGKASAYIGATGTVQLLGRSLKALEAKGNVSLNGSAGTASVTVKLAGTTVYSKSSSSSVTWSASYTKTFLQVTAPIPVGPITVRVNGSVSGTLSGSETLSVGSKGVSVSGSVGAYATGSASVGVGIPGYNVSLKATLNLLSSTLSPSVSVGPSSQSGSVKLSFNAASILFQLVAKAWPLSWTTNLASYSSGSSSKTLVKF